MVESATLGAQAVVGQSADGGRPGLRPGAAQAVAQTVRMTRMILRRSQTW
jgi:hypothetical protein